MRKYKAIQLDVLRDESDYLEQIARGIFSAVPSNLESRAADHSQVEPTAI